MGCKIMTIGSIGGSYASLAGYTPPVARGTGASETAAAAATPHSRATGASLSASGAAGNTAAVNGSLEGSDVARKKVNEPCQTCESRAYQDGSDDPGVSFKSAAHIDPDVAASVVMGHEMEHVAHEQARAKQEDRQVLSQSVVLHTSICPECGRTYVAGGTTETVTAAEKKSPEDQAQELLRMFGAGNADPASSGNHMDKSA